MTKPPRHKRRWTAKEDRVLHDFYYRYGPAWCAKKLGRSTHGVRHRVQRAVVPIEDRPRAAGQRLMSLMEAAFLCDVTPATVRQAAKRRGKLIQYGFRAFVPKVWAETFSQRVRKQRDVQNMGWYTREHLERAFDLSDGGGPLAEVRRGRQGVGFALVERVRTKKGLATARNRKTGDLVHVTRYNPWDLEELERDWRNGEPVLTDRQRALLVLLKRGHRPIHQRERWAFYHVDLGDRCFGPVPQAAMTWLCNHGSVQRVKRPDPELGGRWRTHYDLTPEGYKRAVQIEKSGRINDLISVAPEGVLDSAA